MSPNTTMGINLESSIDNVQLEGESQFILPKQQMLNKNNVNRMINFNKALHNSRKQHGEN